MMQYILLVALASILLGCDGNVFLPSNSRCGDWVPYKDEQCIKIGHRGGLQTKTDAEATCESYADGGSSEDIPKLITIKTKDKQDFLKKYLFEDERIVDNVWLGLDLGEDGEFKWHDGMKLHFTNWQEKIWSFDSEDRLGKQAIAYGPNAPTKFQNCVQMDSGEGAYETGKWVRANCQSSVRIVCEKRQPWSTSTLQNVLVNFKIEFDRYKKDAEQHLAIVRQEAQQNINSAKQQAEQRIASANEEIKVLKRNPVPIGFIYVENPEQPAPTILWPNTKWENVSEKYAGIFFRVEGGGSAPFGEIQEGANPRLEQIEQVEGDHVRHLESNPVTIPGDGSWSRYFWDGQTGGRNIFMRFHLSRTEVRPRNQAIRIWKRVG